MPEIETDQGQARKQALKLEFIQKPQDGRADTVLNLAIAPSFVMYNGQTVKRVTDFFHTEEVPLCELVTASL